MLKRRLTSSAHAAASSLGRVSPGERRPAAPESLCVCVLCRRDFVTPVHWEPLGDDRWWMYLRCGACGTSRELIVSNDVADRYDEELAKATKSIARAAHRLDLERMTDEANAFVEALRRDWIEPEDFALGAS